MFYGHSNGGLLAYELTKKLKTVFGVKPEMLFLAAKRCPVLGSEKPLHALPREEFIHVLKSYGGTSEQVLQTPELLDVYLPILRADFALSEKYQFTPGERQNVPVCLLSGEQDQIASQSDLMAWGELFGGPVEHRVVPGGHFFLDTHFEDLLTILNSQFELMTVSCKENQ
jgi:medium-chain acyl-[acyl-carrier-protein] hydrolase